MKRIIGLWLILVFYVALAFFLSVLDVKLAFYGLSTILGTTILGTTVLGTTVLGTTVLGTTILGSTMLGTTSMIDVYAKALVAGQLAISLISIGMLSYLELSEPNYGRTKKIIEELRGSWMPLSALLVILLILIITFRVLQIFT